MTLIAIPPLLRVADRAIRAYHRIASLCAGKTRLPEHGSVRERLLQVIRFLVHVRVDLRKHGAVRVPQASLGLWAWGRSLCSRLHPTVIGTVLLHSVPLALIIPGVRPRLSR